MGYRIDTDAIATGKIAVTDAGGLAVKMINKTGADSVKGKVVTADSAVDNAVILVPLNIPNPIGVFLEDDIPDGEEAWIVISGIADVLFINAPTRGYLARTFLNADTTKESGLTLSEAVPSSPFAADKHFCEIGHILETKAAAGLAKCLLHFN
jgi:hypothetical protein